MDATPAGTDVVLVVGAMRTGTTLVARTLDEHPDVTYLGFELAEEWADWTGLPWGAPGADDIACPPLGADAATQERAASVRDGLSDLLDERQVTRPGTVVLKSPHFWHRLPFLCALFPGARIVRTRRGPLPTVASLRRLWERSLRDHGRVHHLPPEQDRCWDFVPEDEREDHDPRRTFPGGDVRVLAEFCRRVETALDRFTEERPERVVAEAHQEDLVADPGRAVARLQEALGLRPVASRPPATLDPGRNEEWRTLLSRDEQRTILDELQASPGVRAVHAP